MKLNRREKILAGVTLGLVVVGGLWFLLLAGDSQSYDELLQKQSKLDEEIAAKEKLRDATARDAKRLAQWRRQALPSDPALALSLYQNWLSNLAAKSHFRGARLASPDSGTGAHREQFTRISFTLSAQAGLGDLIEFLYGFYQAGFLHQIRKLDVKPVSQGSRELSLNLTIEALSLPQADAKTQLPQQAGRVLKLAKLSDYRDPIALRDLFAAYVRQAPVSTPRREETVDLAEFAVVTGFTEVDEAWKVWFQDRTVRPQGKLWQLGSGESFTVGNVKGTVQAIRPEGEVIVDFDGHRRLLHLGDNLHGGVEIHDQRPNQSQEGGNSTPLTPDRDN